MDKITIIIWLWLTTGLAVANEVSQTEPALPETEAQQTIPQALLDQVEQGNAESAFFIGMAFVDGTMAVERDEKQALVWFQKAAELGHVHSMYETGRLLFKNEQYGDAKKWFDQAAAAGHGDAYYRSALYYIYQINGTEFDCKKAYERMEQAQLRSVKPAFNDHAWMLSTLPQDECRNGQLAWKIFADLQNLYGAMEPIPWAYLDTKAAVLAEIADYNEAIEIQSWIVEDFCDVEFAKDENKFKLSVDEITTEFSQSDDALCYGSIQRLQAYINRKPWRETPQFN